MGDTGGRLPKEEPNLVESGQGPYELPTFHSSLAIGLSRQRPCTRPPWLPELAPPPPPPQHLLHLHGGGGGRSAAGPQQVLPLERQVSVGKWQPPRSTETSCRHGTGLGTSCSREHFTPARSLGEGL